MESSIAVIESVASTLRKQYEDELSAVQPLVGNFYMVLKAAENALNLLTAPIDEETAKLFKDLKKINKPTHA
jgi:UTP:GlnB (protein PII) uridylyltransferase